MFSRKHAQCFLGFNATVFLLYPRIGERRVEERVRRVSFGSATADGASVELLAGIPVFSAEPRTKSMRIWDVTVCTKGSWS